MYKQREPVIKQAHIPNKILEKMFMDVADKREKEIFLEYVDTDWTSLATAYASRVVLGWWNWLLFEKDGTEEGGGQNERD